MAKRVLVKCSVCYKEWMKVSNEIKLWAGRCRPCELKSRKVARKCCIDCGKESYWIKERGRCHKCWIVSWKNKNNHPRWIADRSKIVKRQERNDSAYKVWRMNIWSRDNFKCKFDNVACLGRIEAHHILGWSSHPELRYEINNGITLCHAHHPKVRAEEKRLAPEFQALVSVSKE